MMFFGGIALAVVGALLMTFCPKLRSRSAYLEFFALLGGVALIAVGLVMLSQSS